MSAPPFMTPTTSPGSSVRFHGANTSSSRSVTVLAGASAASVSFAMDRTPCRYPKQLCADRRPGEKPCPDLLRRRRLRAALIGHGKHGKQDGRFAATLDEPPGLEGQTGNAARPCFPCFPCLLWLRLKS